MGVAGGGGVRWGESYCRYPVIIVRYIFPRKTGGGGGDPDVSVMSKGTDVTTFFF